MYTGATETLVGLGETPRVGETIRTFALETVSIAFYSHTPTPFNQYDE